MTVERKTMRDDEKIDADTIGGNRVLSFKVTLAGSAPHTINFKALGMLPMADATYRIFPAGETAGLVKVDESETTEAQFKLLGGVAGEIVHFLVHGVQSEE